MHRYFAYGMTIDSDLPLPELLPGIEGANSDAAFRFGSVDPAKPPGVNGASNAWATPGMAMMRFEEGVTFLVRDGREITIDRAEGLPDDTVRLFLLGPVLSALLHQRGFLVLHGSSAVIGGNAVAFVAEKGTGKSTLAAAFHARGHGIVTDDLVAVDVDSPRGPLVYPGFPQLKLYPEAAAQIDACPDALPRVSAGLDKRSCRAAAAFPGARLPLRRVYALTNDTREAITPLPPQRAFIELVRHTFVLNMLRASGEEVSHFRQAVSLATGIPVCILSRRRSLSLLPDVVKMVEADVAA